MSDKEKKFNIIEVVKQTFISAKILFKQTGVLFTYGLILVGLSIIFSHWSYSCKLDSITSWWCFESSNNLYFAWTKVVLYIFLIAYFYFSFVYDIYNSAYNKQPFLLKNLYKPSLKRLKFMGSILLASLLFIVPILICLYILFKKANPDWRIEAVYFCILFTLAMIPIMMMRFSVAGGYYLKNGHIPNLWKVYEQTSGKFYVVIVCTFMIFVLENYIQSRVSQYFNLLSFKYNYFAFATISEYINTLFKLSYLIFVLAFIIGENEILEPKLKNKE